MTFKAALVFIALHLLSACSGTGYNRSYITTDTFEEQVLSEVEKNH